MIFNSINQHKNTIMTPQLDYKINLRIFGLPGIAKFQFLAKKWMAEFYLYYRFDSLESGAAPPRDSIILYPCSRYSIPQLHLFMLCLKRIYPILPLFDVASHLLKVQQRSRPLFNSSKSLHQAPKFSIRKSIDTQEDLCVSKTVVVLSLN